MSFFTGKSAANDSVKRKSTQNEDKQQPVDNDQNTSDRKISEKAKSSNESADTSQSSSTIPKRPIESDICLPSHVNSSLTTPLCWSKHSALLADIVGSHTSVQTSQWSCEQVVEFLGKFGINSLLLERFKHEVKKLFVPIRSLEMASFNGTFV